MRYLVILILLSFSFVTHAQSLKKHAHKNQLHPGISIAYLPTWVLDDIRGNTPGSVIIASLNAHQEIWKESVLKLGVGRGKQFGPKVDDQLGTILPIKLQKFFVPERKGFNLSAGMVLNFCETCYEGFDGALTNEIGYLFNGRVISINAALQIMAGALFDDLTVHVGLGVEVVYVGRISGTN